MVLTMSQVTVKLESSGLLDKMNNKHKPHTSEHDNATALMRMLISMRRRRLSSGFMLTRLLKFIFVFTQAKNAETVLQKILSLAVLI